MSGKSAVLGSTAKNVSKISAIAIDTVVAEIWLGHSLVNGAKRAARGANLSANSSFCPSFALPRPRTWASVRPLKISPSQQVRIFHDRLPGNENRFTPWLCRLPRSRAAGRSCPGRRQGARQGQRLRNPPERRGYGRGGTRTQPRPDGPCHQGRERALVPDRHEGRLQGGRGREDRRWRGIQEAAGLRQEPALDGQPAGRQGQGRD